MDSALFNKLIAYTSRGGADTKVSCVPNPDVAGLGIIVSFTIGASATLILSGWCFCLKWRLVRYEAERFENAHPYPYRWATDLIGSLWPLLYDDHPLWLVPRNKLKERGKWHRILDEMLLGISMNQLLQAFALILCSLGTYGFSSKDPHSAVAVGLSTLSAFSQLAVPFVVRQPNSRSTITRTASILLFQLLVVVLDLVYSLSQPRDAGLAFFLGLAIAMDVAVLGFLGLTLADLIWPKQAESKTFWRSRALQFTVITLIALSNTFTTMFGLYVAKFSPSSKCNLNTTEEDKWTLGQIMAIVMLLGLVLPGLDSYFDQSEKVEQEENLELNEATNHETGNEAVRMDFEPDMPANSRMSRRTTGRIESQQ